MGPQARLRDLGLELPFAPVPAGSYVPATQTGNLIFTAGQLPLRDGELHRTGKVGAADMLEEAQEAAGLCGFNAVAAEKAGGLDNLRDVVKVTGFVASTPGFNGQPDVSNGASELLEQIFGEAGPHARSAVGVVELPLDAPVEVEVVFGLDTPA
jgi:enamine deaminase RidA (YjgF/YER057c/UK114 family)